MVLCSVANDYEEYEMVIHEITRWMNNLGETPDTDQIEYSLMKSIVDENIKAYETSEALHRFVPTKADIQNLHVLWYYITEQGKIRLESLGGGWDVVPGAEARK